MTALVIGAAAGAVSGGTSETMKQGALTSYNAETYNRQLHVDEIKWIKENAKRFAQEESERLGHQVTEQEAMDRLITQAAQEVDYAWFKKIGETDGQAQSFLRGATAQGDVPPYDNRGTFINSGGKRQSMFTVADKDEYYSTGKYSNALAQFDKANGHVVTKTLQPKVKYNLYTKSLSDGADAALKGTLHAFDHPEDVLKPIGFGIANCLKEDMCISSGKEMLSDSGKAVWQSGKDIFGAGYHLDDVNYLYGKNMVNEIDAIAAVRGGTALLELTGVGKAAGKAASTIGDAAVNYVRFKLPKGSNANEVLPIVGETKGYDLESFNYEAHNLVNYEKYKQQLRQENLDNIAKLYPELSHAALGKNNFTYKDKMFTKAESDELGRAWVGPNYEVTSQGGFISEDRTRRYRPATSKKNSSYADTGIQSNFERFYIDPITGSSKVESNLHLNIYEDKK